jgi:hypothetical protein
MEYIYFIFTRNLLTNQINFWRYHEKTTGFLLFFLLHLTTETAGGNNFIPIIYHYNTNSLIF